MMAASRMKRTAKVTVEGQALVVAVYCNRAGMRACVCLSKRLTELERTTPSITAAMKYTTPTITTLLRFSPKRGL